MKINCEIDWVGEGEELDGLVVDRIVDAVVDKVSKGLYERVEREASEKLAFHIDELLNKLTDRFMNKEIAVTDSWGDIQEKHDNVNELLKRKFDKFLTQMVNSDGKAVNSCSYGEKNTRLHWLLDNRIAKHSDKITKEMASTIESKIKAMKEEVMTKAIAKVVGKLGLDVVGK
jgi:hypothetical protein